MYRIGEFSRITEIPVKTLRYYHEEGLLIPDQIDDATGYRFYDEPTYEKARRVRLLRELEFSIDEIREVLENVESDEDLTWYLSEKAQHLQTRVAHYRTLQKRIQKLCNEKERKPMHTISPVEIYTLESKKIAGIRFSGNYDDVGSRFGKLFGAVGGSAASPAMCIYHDSEFREQDADIECCVEVRKDISKPGIETRTLEGGKYLKVTFTGPYNELSHAYHDLMQYATRNSLETREGSINIFIKGPGMLFKGNPNEYVTDVLIPFNEL